MTQRVYLHVGAPKSGTTYLQQILRTNRDRLEAAGVLVAGESHVELVHAAMVVRDDARLERLPARARGSWSRVVDQVRGWSGDSAVVSYELFAGASADQVRAALADLDGLEIHVVITARDFGRSVASAWQERLKFALTTPLEKWVPRPETAVRSEWGWRTMDPSGVAARWGADLAPERVHVVTAPREASSTELWHRFAEACGLSEVVVEFPDYRANTSLGVAAAELLRRVNEYADAPLDTNREQARWLRDLLAHDILAPLDDEPIGITESQYADATKRAEACRDAVTKAGYAVHGDLADLIPASSEARTPAQVEDSELVDVAVRALLRLVLRVREDTNAQRAAAAPAAPQPPSSLRAKGKNIVSGTLGRRVLAENQRLQRRLDAVEAQLAESRALQSRLAMVTDLVTELLVPPRTRNDATIERALRSYRQETL
ncbi:MAG TPA: DUF6752 domain-containing protein [Nocardioides sp.]|jgi:hypothetical protein